MTSSGKYDVFLNGVGYMLMEEPDTAFGSRPALEHQSVRAQREQSVAQGNIGEATVNPLGFWRRSIDGWYHGSGQAYYDRVESDSLRFRASAGVDVFGTRHQLTLLHSYDQALTYTPGLGGGPHLLAFGAGAYFSDGVTLKYTSSPLTTPWTTTTVTGTPTYTAGICVLANQIYLAANTQGVYSGTILGATVASFATGGTITGVASAKGRLFAWNSNALYNITAAGALPSPLVTFASGSPVTGVVGAANWVYIAVGGDPSYIYKTTVKPDGTALDVPSVAGELPDGERLDTNPDGSAIFAYLNNVFVFTNRGVRMGTIDANGDITFGSLIPLNRTNGIGTWAATDRFVWVGGPDGNTTGAIKMDLSVSILPNTPAYAADADPGHTVYNLASYGGRLIVGDSNGTIWVESATNYLSTGHVDSGLIAIDLADPKAPVAFDVEAATPSTSSITEALSYDRGATFTTVGVFNTADSDESPITGVAAARQFEIRTTLTGDGSTGTPTLYRHTLKTEPAIAQDVLIQVKLRLYESIVDNGGMTVHQDPEALRVGLEALQQSRQAVTFTRGGTSYQVTVRDLDTEAHSRCAAGRDGSWNTMATATLKVLPS